MKLNRFQKAVLLILYERTGQAVEIKTVLEEISRRGLIKMSDEEFDEYHRQLVSTKRN